MSEVSPTMRRLPVYLVLDVSGSMNGEPITALEQGLKLLVGDLKNDPQALETVWLSVITFSSEAKVVSPLTEMLLFKEPKIQAGGFTNIGEALKLLKECIEKDVRQTTETQKGDWKPMVFLMTDGRPTDDWTAANQALQNSVKANIICCAAGPSAEDHVLKQISPTVIRLADCSAGALGKFMEWVSKSVQTTSQSVGVKGEGPVALPDLPKDEGITLVP